MSKRAPKSSVSVRAGLITGNDSDVCPQSVISFTNRVPKMYSTTLAGIGSLVHPFFSGVCSEPVMYYRIAATWYWYTVVSVAAS